MLWTAAWTLRNRYAEPADLKRCIFRSRRRTTWCEFSARLFIRSPLLMTAGQAKGLERGGIGAQLVGDRQLGRKALLLEWFAHQLRGRPFIPARLDQQIEDLALLNLFGDTANRWMIFQFHACAACCTDREFAVAPVLSARMIRAPRRKVT